MILSEVSLSGDWTSVFERIPGWKPSDAGGVWEADGVFFIEAGGSEAEHIEIFLDSKTAVRIEGEQVKNVSRNLGVLRREALLEKNQRAASLNHFALNINVLSSSPFSEYASLVSNVLGREARFDPVLGKDLESAHFYEENKLYITERYIPDIHGNKIDHIGFECVDKELVDEIFSKISPDFKIALAPSWVDGSYLFHFYGPDGRIHDFFFVGEDLKSKQRT